jgi:hypothetical protein
MAVTELEENQINDMLYELDMCQDDEKKCANIILDVWNKIWEIMIRENNFSEELGSVELDWQVMNCANDATIYLHNAKRYEEEIKVCEQILKIKWGRNGTTDNRMYENAKRDMADAYAYMGNYEKCMELYDQYLQEDPLWGWAWIGYYRQLHDHNDERFESTLDKLLSDLENGVEYRDKKYLLDELEMEYTDLKKFDKRERCVKLIIESSKKNREELDRKFNDFMSKYGHMPVVVEKKIYPNNPCPCGSGKKYKKCCGK